MDDPVPLRRLRVPGGWRVEWNDLREDDDRVEVWDEGDYSAPAELFVAAVEHYRVCLSRRPGSGAQPTFEITVWSEHSHPIAPPEWIRPVRILRTNNYDEAAELLEDQLQALQHAPYGSLPEQEHSHFERLTDALVPPGVDWPSRWDDVCIYDNVDDQTARTLMIEWVAGRAHTGTYEIAKLLAGRGQLIAEQMTPIIERLAAGGDELDWTRRCHYLSIGYVVSLPPADAERLALRFLDLMPEDFRDGVLLACYRLGGSTIDAAVQAKFRQWLNDWSWCGSSTGELAWVRAFLDKWDQAGPAGPHRDIIELCRKHDEP